MKKIDLPAEVTKTIYVAYGLGKYNTGNIAIRDYCSDGASEGFEELLLCTTEITVSLPNNITETDAIKELVAKLEKRKGGIQAQYHLKISEIDNQIQNLLAIDFQPEAA